ncbi:protein TIFY 10a-like [Silene latifolia]|uniref:protein TIFY 10a-like n=1 Tax=Silene latifolia TaxID=37657 RepID=UPI003D77E44B
MSNSLAQKMSFSQTCNLLSQYVKEKRALGFSNNLDTSRGASTMNLFPVKQAEDSNDGSVGRTIDLFPQISGFNSSVNKRATPEPPAAQMTIFYGGQVVVFNDLPADKATEVMNLASSFESSLKKRKVETPATPVPVPSPKASINENSNPNPNPNPIPSLSQPQNLTVGAPSFGNNVIPAAAAVSQPAVRVASDLPIARKASLHRFLEKRKDRIVGKAPLCGDGVDGGAAKPVNGNAWLGLNSLPIFQQQQL